MKKGNKGITLIALIITVIILLILASITINLTIGQKGIITRAEEAGRNYMNAAVQEDKQLGDFINEIDKIEGNKEEIKTNPDIFLYTEEGVITGIKEEYLIENEAAEIKKGRKYASLQGIKIATRLRTYNLKQEIGTTIYIPKEIKGTKIKEIGEEAFRGIENLERVVLPEGITTIGNNAFSNCSLLNSVNLPNGIINVGYCFVECMSLKYLYIPSSVSMASIDLMLSRFDYLGISKIVECEMEEPETWSDEAEKQLSELGLTIRWGVKK